MYVFLLSKSADSRYPRSEDLIIQHWFWLKNTITINHTNSESAKSSIIRSHCIVSTARGSSICVFYMIWVGWRLITKLFLWIYTYFVMCMITSLFLLFVSLIYIISHEKKTNNDGKFKTKTANSIFFF